jgi:hypothetical protein
MSTFDDFRAHHPIGSRVGDDSLVASGEETEATKYQCVSFVKAYIRECYGLEPGYWGHAIQYWTQPNQALLSKFYQVSNSEAQKGDIVMLWGLPGNPYGHIGIATGGLTAISVEILEQNGSTGNGTGTGGDAIRTRYVDRSRVAGLLRPVVVAVAVNPVTWYEPVGKSERQTTKQPTNWWNLNNTTKDISSFHPAAVLNSGTPFTVGGLAHHINGYVYAMTPEDFSRAQNGDYSTNNGINELDLELRAPPVYTPPAPPISATPVEFYTLITNVMRFSSPTDALHHQNYQGDLTEGQYIVIAKQEKAYNLSDDNMKDRGWWINIDDNRIPDPTPPAPQQDTDIVHPEVEPVDFPATIEQPKIVSHSLRADGAVVMYQATNSQPIEIK